MYEINILDKHTGKLLKDGDWEAVVLNPPDADFIMNLNKSGTRFSAKNIHLSLQEKKELPTDKHQTLGNYIDLSDNTKKYSKIYHRHTPLFSNTTYKAFWFDLTVRLSKDTNIIYIIENQKIRFANSRQDLINICGAKKSKFYEFYRECLEKSFIAEFRTNEIIYIINPHYALNGNKIPEVLYDLFNKSAEEYEEV